MYLSNWKFTIHLIAYVIMSRCSKFHIHSLSRSWDIEVFDFVYFSFLPSLSLIFFLMILCKEKRSLILGILCIYFYYKKGKRQRKRKNKRMFFFTISRFWNIARCWYNEKRGFVEILSFSGRATFRGLFKPVSSLC